MTAIRFATVGTLSVLVLAILVPLLIGPTVTAGAPDDVAELMPSDTMMFVELVKAPLILKDWKAYVGAITLDSGREKVVNLIAEAVEGQLEIVPEKLLKDLRRGCGSIQRIAVGVTPPQGEGDPGVVIVATSSDETFFRTIVDEDLRVFAGNEKDIHGTRVLFIRRLGELSFPEPVLIAAPGSRLVVTLNERLMTQTLARAAGKGVGKDLRENGFYSKLAPAASDEPMLRIFGEMPWNLMMAPRPVGAHGYHGFRRRTAYEMDIVDSVLGFRKIAGFTSEVTFRPGELKTVSRIHVDPGCALFETFRQEPGSKDLLRYYPKETLLLTHANLKSGETVWKEIASMIERVDANMNMREERSRTAMESLDREFQRGFGITPSEITAEIGNEIAFGMVGEDAFGSEGNMVRSLLFSAKVLDADKAETILDGIVELKGDYTKKVEGAATLYLTEKDPVFALQGKVVMIGGSAETIRAAIRAADSGEGYAADISVDTAKCSKLISIRNRVIWDLLTRGMRADLPDLSEDLDLDQVTTALIREEKDHVRSESTSSLVGLMQSSLAMTAFPFLQVSRIRSYGAPTVGAVVRDEPLDEAEPLPADRLGKRVAELIEGLRSDGLVEREDADEALRKLGRQAIPLLVKAVRQESDVDVRVRLVNLLEYWKAYEAFPELLQRKADAFLREFARRAGDSEGYFGSRWRESGEGRPFQYALEPMYVDLTILDAIPEIEILESPAGLSFLADRLTEEKMPVELIRKIAVVLAFRGGPGMGEAVMKAQGRLSDPEAKVYLQIALGLDGTKESRTRLLSGMQDADPWMRRASFLGIESAGCPEAVTKLIALLKDPDVETRWNASFTLRILTGNRLYVNVFLPEKEFEAAHRAASDWWADNRATLRFDGVR